jgi:hypothetical protein
MKTEHELNDEILKITMKIRESYPELSKYITEMPVTIPNVVSPEINVKTLSDYHDSLLELMRKYAHNHF